MKLDVHEGQRLLHMLDIRSSVIGMPLTQTQIATGVMRAKEESTERLALADYVELNISPIIGLPNETGGD